MKRRAEGYHLDNGPDGKWSYPELPLMVT